MRRPLALACIAAVFLLPSAGCGRRAVTAAGAKPVEITVAAASDLKAALPAVIEAFEKDSGAEVIPAFGSSGLLAAQIENGAPVDIFLSADKRLIDELAAKKMLVERERYARGAIVLVGRAKSIDELASPAVSKIAIANPAHAPYGRAAKEALVNSGVWAAVKPKLVYAENVSQALEFTRTGNADAGLTALSLTGPKKISFTPISADLYRPIDQWAGLTADSKNPKVSAAFIDFLSDRRGRALLQAFGFQTQIKDTKR